jgi:hypothetical protein
MLRDGRVAIHTLSPEDIHDEFHVTGVAHAVADAAVRAAAVANYHTAVADDHILFRIDLHAAMSASYEFRGQWPPTHRTWKAR